MEKGLTMKEPRFSEFLIFALGVILCVRLVLLGYARDTAATTTGPWTAQHGEHSVKDRTAQAAGLDG